MENSTVQIIIQAGSLGVLLVVLVGLYLLAKLSVPKIVDFFNGLISEQKAHRDAVTTLTVSMTQGFAIIDSKMGQGFASIETRVALAEERIGGVVSVSEHAVVDAVRERASHTTNEIRRELGSAGDDTLPSGRPVVAPRVAAGR